MNNISIKLKAYLLVLLSILTAVVLSVVSIFGLNEIGDKLTSLEMATEVERDAYKTILQEKIYLLNSNISTEDNTLAENAFVLAKENIANIYKTLDTIDSIESDKEILQKSKIARKDTKEYENLYNEGVSVIQKLKKSALVLHKDGSLATLQAKNYVEEKREELQKKLSYTLVKKTNIATDIWKLTYNIRANEKIYMLTQKEEAFQLMKNHFKEMLSKLKMLKSIASNSSELEKIETFYKAAKSYESAAHQWVGLNKKLTKEILPKMKNAGGSVVKQAEDAANSASQSMREKKSSIKSTLMVVMVLSILLGLMLGAFIVNSIKKSITALQNYMSNLSSTHDLTLRSQNNSQDEIGEISKQLNSLIAMFNNLIAGFKNSSIENASMAHELSTTAIGVGKNVENSVTIVNEATADSRAIQNEIVEAIADAQNSKEKIIKANTNLKDARGEIVTLTTRVQTSAQTEAQLAQNMEELSGEANNVKEVLTIISDIADQTNLLALNAAIEAARAGEHGRGFAVVADEVRKLAERTQKTLSEINATINVVVQSIGDASSQMVENSKDILELADIAQEVEQKINLTAELVDEAVSASDKTVGDFESTGKSVGVIISKVEEINEISSVNARSVEEIAATAEHLNALTDELNVKLETFRT